MFKTENLAKLLQCWSCRATNVLHIDDAVRCTACGYEQRFGRNNILLNPELEQSGHKIEDTSELQTRHRYQSQRYAEQYRRKYTQAFGWFGRYDSYLANCECESVRLALAGIAGEIDLLLDFPAGTGKLSGIFDRLSLGVVGADISRQMLETGVAEWEQCSNMIGLVQSDICNTNFRSASFDCIVSLRLLHRLPDDTALRALQEMARIGRKYIVVSAAIQRFCAASVLGRKSTRQSSRRSHRKWHELLSSVGEVSNELLVSPTLSSEIVSVVKLNKTETVAANEAKRVRKITGITATVD